MTKKNFSLSYATVRKMSDNNCLISVKSCYAVEKDVDFGVWNITNKGTGVVKGNVRSGFILDS